MSSQGRLGKRGFIGVVVHLIVESKEVPGNSFAHDKEPPAEHRYRLLGSISGLPSSFFFIFLISEREVL